MNQKTLNALAGSLIAWGLWRIAEDVILKNKSMAAIHESASVRSSDAVSTEGHKKISEIYSRRANLAEVVQSLNPWTYIVPPMMRLYDRYKARDYSGFPKQ